MNWLALKIAALLTAGGALAGATLFQIVAGRLKPREIGPRFATALAAILVGFGYMPGLAPYSRWITLGAVVTLGAAIVQTARNKALEGKRDTKQLP